MPFERLALFVEMNIRLSVQNLAFLPPGFLFFNQQQTYFLFACFSTMPNGNCKKKTFDLERRTV